MIINTYLRKMNKIKDCCERAYQAIFILNKIDKTLMDDINIMCKQCGSIIRKGKKNEN